MTDFDPGFSDSGTVTLDQLVASDNDIITRSVTQLSGEGALLRGTLMGVVSTNSASGALKGGATGNPTIGAVTTGLDTKEGVYVAYFTAATKYDLRDPDGNIVVEQASTGAAVTANDHLGFTITAGGTPAVAGDQMLITVVATNKYRKAVAASVDGSQHPVAILAKDTDSTSADKVTLIYENGTFNENSLILGAGTTITDQIRKELRKLGIFLKIASKA